MLAIFSALFGVLASLLPEAIKYFKGRQDNAHEISVLQIQADLQKAGASQKLAEINVQADISEGQAIYQFANPKSGWAEQINASVRPAVTYLLLAGYLYSKWVTKTPWNDTDMAIFSGVIGFWFGSRAIAASINQPKVSGILPNWQDTKK